jgi:hypothetical protein
MIHWKIEGFNPYKPFDYVRGVSVSLTYMALQISLEFNVRCKLRILDEKDKIVFSSLLEVDFVVQDYELSESLLVDYIKEATELYLEEFEITKKETELQTLKPDWPALEDWKRVAGECIERLPSLSD